MILGVTLPSKTSKKMVCITKKKNHLKYVSGKSGSTHVPCVFVCFLFMYVGEHAHVCM